MSQRTTSARTLTDLLFERAEVGLCLVAPDGTMLRANSEWLRSTGFTLDRVLGADILDLFPDERDMAAALQARARLGFHVEVPPHAVRIDGSDTWWEGSIDPVPLDGGTGLLIRARQLPAPGVALRDASGAWTGTLGVLRDVAENKRLELEHARLLEASRVSESQIRASHERFMAAMSGSPVVVFEQDLDLRYTWIANPAVGYSADEVVGKTDYDLVERREYADALVSLKRAVLTTGEPRRQEMAVENKGQMRWYDVNVQPRRVGGALVGIIATATDITEGKHSEERLREAELRKNDFLAMLSHELRNPLSPIRSSAYILEHADQRTSEAVRAREILRRQSEHLSRLVDDLLDVTRITHGKIALRRSLVDLRELVLVATEDFQRLLEAREVGFRTVVPEAAVWVDADPTRVNQVIMNLLHNASKFTRRGDEVVVSLRTAEGSAVLAVRDTGAGIDAALRPHLFDPFVQGSRTLARSEGGLGLGLALVKGLVELHGGEVRATSEGPDKGAEFVVRLPLQPGPPVQSPPSESPPISAVVHRVVVVDDNADAAESLADLLRLFGHEAKVALDGHDAIEKIRAWRPDVVLCDIGLPGMDGYDVARAIRAGEHSGVLLIALTGYAQEEDVQRAREAGFDAHFAKPLDPASLERVLARGVRRSDSADQPT